MTVLKYSFFIDLRANGLFTDAFSRFILIVEIGGEQIMPTFFVIVIKGAFLRKDSKAQKEKNK